MTIEINNYGIFLLEMGIILLLVFVLGFIFGFSTGVKAETKYQKDITDKAKELKEKQSF